MRFRHANGHITNTPHTSLQQTHFPGFPECLNGVLCFPVVVDHAFSSRKWRYHEHTSLIAGTNNLFCYLFCVNHLLVLCAWRTLLSSGNLLRRRDDSCDDETIVVVMWVVFFVVRRRGPPAAVEVHHFYQFNVFTFRFLVLGLD